MKKMDHSKPFCDGDFELVAFDYGLDLHARPREKKHDSVLVYECKECGASIRKQIKHNERS